MAAWYVGSVQWTAVTAWAAVTSYSVGALRRQLATPTVGQERVFRCTTAGLSGSAEPAPWTLTVGSTTNDGTAVWTEVTGNATYNWTAPHSRLANALASGWGAAGDDFWISEDHAESGAGITLTAPGTAASPCRIICVNHAGTVPPVSTDLRATATITGSGVIGFSGFFYCYGISFVSTSVSGSATVITLSSNNVAPAWSKFESCSFTAGSGATQRIALGATGSSATDDQRLECENCTWKFGAVGQSIVPAGLNIIRGGSFAPTGSVPTVLFSPLIAVPLALALVGVDISTLGSGKSLVNVGIASSSGVATFTDCKLGSSISITTGTHIGQGGVTVRAVNCDSADTNYRYFKQTYQGTITQETTIVRTGGATDGTTPVSRKMVSTANSKFYSPLESDWITLWNETTNVSLTATIEIITDGVTLTDAEVGIKIEYLGTGGSPLGNFVSDLAADILAVGVDQTTSSVTWTTTGLSSPTKQKLEKAFTAQKKGPFRVCVCLAKPSTTLYFCPKVSVA